MGEVGCENLLRALANRDRAEMGTGRGTKQERADQRPRPTLMKGEISGGILTFCDDLSTGKPANIAALLHYVDDKTCTYMNF